MKTFSSAFFLTLLCSLTAGAATVSQIKGTRALIDLEGSEAAEGDEFFVMNPTTHKKVAVIRLRQIKGSKAIAEILKGKVQEGFSLQAKAASATTEKTTEKTPENAEKTPPQEEDNTPAPIIRDTSYSRTLKPAYGVLGEYLMDTMKVQVKDALNAKDTAALTGSGFGVGGFYEYILTRDISLRLLGAFEQFNVTGSSTITGCDSKTSTNCDAKILYISAYGLGKYYFTQSRARFWAGAGGGFLLALSKSSTALDQGAISTNQVLTVGAGMDWQLSRKQYIPVSLEYNYFPPSDTVNATVIAIKAGFAWQ